ncbi:MAG TPA: tetratricopeptide repeat protein [Nitrososphaeraceae archaeon]|nr:tetratricopeptide repeat protein [Nitrososphaeraceae archaeon]
MVLGWLFKKRSKPEQETIAYKKVSRKEAAEEYVKHGEDMANANRLEEAIQYFDKALAVDPRNSFAWGDRALILDKQGKLEEALQSFSKSLITDSKNAITWHNKGLTLLRLGRLQEAVQCFDTAIEFKDDYSKAWYNKGRALSMIGEINKSQECFDKARKLDPLLYTKLRKLK